MNLRGVKQPRMFFLFFFYCRQQFQYKTLNFFISFYLSYIQETIGKLSSFYIFLIFAHARCLFLVWSTAQCSRKCWSLSVIKRAR